MTRPARIALVVAVLAAVQGAVLLVYSAVERSRAARAKPPAFEGERLHGAEAAPSLDAVLADGRPIAFTWPAVLIAA